MKLGGELEAADAIGGFRETFVLGERVHFEDALRVIRILLAPPTIGRKGFGAELGPGKPRPLGNHHRCHVGLGA